MSSAKSEASNQRLVICLTGMPGAGKSTAAQTSEPLGFKIFRMGDDVRMEAEKRSIEPTDENLGAVMLQLRQAQGIVAIAKLCKQRIEKDTSRLVLIDGVRNVNEFFEFRKLGKAVLVTIHTTPEKRFQFLQARGRSDSPQSFQSFEARDRRELSVGIGEAIALADEVIVNNGSEQALEEAATELFKTLKQNFSA